MRTLRLGILFALASLLPAANASPYPWAFLTPSERIALAERIGEDGVAKYAAERQLTPLLHPRRKTIAIGPDSIYWNRASGKVMVLEAKGGSSQPKRTYGTVQGTNANALQSAAGLLAARNASPNERLQAARVIKAAQRGSLRTAIVRTPHVLGSPLAPRRIGPTNADLVAHKARAIERQLIQGTPTLERIFRQAAATPERTLPRLSGHWLVPAGVGTASVLAATQAYRLVTMGLNDPRYPYEIASTAGLVTFAGIGFWLGGPPGGALGALAAIPVQLGFWWAGSQALSETQREAVIQVLVERYAEAPSLDRTLSTAVAY